MSEPPFDLADDRLCVCLQIAYGLAAPQVEFLPWGHDASAWAYRVRVADHRAYFLKVRTRVVNEASLLVPHFLNDRGITRVIGPLATTAGALWAVAGDYALTLYSFVAGTTAMEHRMSAQQMFVVGGISTELVGPDEEELFFRGYGATVVDPLALAYYRYAWTVSDIGAYGEEVFFRPDLGLVSKHVAAESCMRLFAPGNIVALSFASSTKKARTRSGSIL